uniref:Uncharacterized protein n=1 Tax=Zea mays TaxID=4577 RepID=C4J783_MAIZE|nr:unknown [Zea mays]
MRPERPREILILVKVILWFLVGMKFVKRQGWVNVG